MRISQTLSLPLAKLLFIVTFLFLSNSTVAQKKKKSNDKDQPSLSMAETQKIQSEFLEGEKYYLLNNFKKATKHFQNVLEIDGDHGAANFKIGQIHIENSQFSMALPYAEKAKKADPQNKYYFLLLANIQSNLGKIKEAEKTYMEMVETIPNTGSYLFEVANLQLYQGKMKDAIASFDLAEKHLGPMEEIGKQKQQIYLQTNQLDLAIKEGYRLIEKFPNNKNHEIDLIKIMISNNRESQAEALILEEISKNPNNEHFHILLSEIYRKKGLVGKAAETLRKPFQSESIDLQSKLQTISGYISLLPNPSLSEPLLDLMNILSNKYPDSYQVQALSGDLNYGLGNKKEALAAYLKATSIQGTNFNIWQNILTLDMEMGDYNSTASHAKEALEYFPNQAALYYYKGVALQILKNYKEAISTFEDGKKLTSNNPNLNSLFHGQLGDAYNSIGDHFSSDEAYEIALKAEPNNDHVLNNYSYFLSLRKEKLDKALTMSKKLVINYPESSTYLDTHAWVLYMRGDYEEAKVYLEKAIRYDPSAVIVEHYGDTLYKLGQIENALEQWNNAMKMDNDGTSEFLSKKIKDKKLYE